MSTYITDLIHLMPPPGPEYPTEADLTQGPLPLRERAWKHLLLGKKLVPKGEEVKPEMKDVSSINIISGFFFVFD